MCCTAAWRRSKRNTPAQHLTPPTPRFQHPPRVHSHSSPSGRLSRTHPDVGRGCGAGGGTGAVKLRNCLAKLPHSSKKNGTISRSPATISASAAAAAASPPAAAPSGVPEGGWLAACLEEGGVAAAAHAAHLKHCCHCNTSYLYTTLVPRMRSCGHRARAAADNTGLCRCCQRSNSFPPPWYLVHASNGHRASRYFLSLFRGIASSRRQEHG